MFLTCAVTRVMAKRGIENDLCCDIDLADTFIGQIHNTDVNKSLDINPFEFQMDYGTDNIQMLSDHPLLLV